MRRDAMICHVAVYADNGCVGRIHREHPDACPERPAVKHGEKSRIGKPGQHPRIGYPLLDEFQDIGYPDVSRHR